VSVKVPRVEILRLLKDDERDPDTGGNGVVLSRVIGWPMRAVLAYIITAISRDFRRPLKKLIQTPT